MCPAAQIASADTQAHLPARRKPKLGATPLQCMRCCCTPSESMLLRFSSPHRRHRRGSGGWQAQTESGGQPGSGWARREERCWGRCRCCHHHRQDGTCRSNQGPSCSTAAQGRRCCRRPWGSARSSRDRACSTPAGPPALEEGCGAREPSEDGMTCMDAAGWRLPQGRR